MQNSSTWYMRRRSLLCVLCCITAFASFGQVQTDGRESYALDGEVYYYTEEAAPLSAEEAFSLFQKGVFRPLATPGNNVNLGYTERVHWLAFRVSIGDTTEQLEAGVANAGLYRLDHYQFADNGQLLFSHGPTGKRYPFSSRYINNRHYYFPLQRTHQTVTVLFRCDIRGFDFYAPLRLVTQQYREETEQELLTFYIFIEGLLVCVLLFSAIAMIAVRQRVLLYYFLYTLSYVLLIFAYPDWDFPYLYPNLPQWAVISTSMYAIMVVLFMLCFSVTYLEIKKSHPVLYRACRIVMAGIILLLVCIPVFYTTDGWHGGRRFVFMLGTVFINAGWLLQFYMVIIRVRDRFRPMFTRWPMCLLLFR